MQFEDAVMYAVDEMEARVKTVHELPDLFRHSGNRLADLVHEGIDSGKKDYLRDETRTTLEKAVKADEHQSNDHYQTPVVRMLSAYARLFSDYDAPIGEWDRFVRSSKTLRHLRKGNSALAAATEFGHDNMKKIETDDTLTFVYYKDDQVFANTNVMLTDSAPAPGMLGLLGISAILGKSTTITNVPEYRDDACLTRTPEELREMGATYADLPKLEKDLLRMAGTPEVMEFTKRVLASEEKRFADLGTNSL